MIDWNAISSIVAGKYCGYLFCHKTSAAILILTKPWTWDLIANVHQGFFPSPLCGLKPLYLVTVRFPVIVGCGRSIGLLHGQTREIYCPWDCISGKHVTKNVRTLNYPPVISREIYGQPHISPLLMHRKEGATFEELVDKKKSLLQQVRRLCLTFLSSSGLLKIFCCYRSSRRQRVFRGNQWLLVRKTKSVPRTLKTWQLLWQLRYAIPVNLRLIDVC